MHLRKNNIRNKLLFLSNGGKIEDMLKKRIWSHAKTRTLPEELPAAGHLIYDTALYEI